VVFKCSGEFNIKIESYNSLKIQWSVYE